MTVNKYIDLAIFFLIIELFFAGIRLIIAFILGASGIELLKVPLFFLQLIPFWGLLLLFVHKVPFRRKNGQLAFKEILWMATLFPFIDFNSKKNGHEK